MLTYPEADQLTVAKIAHRLLYTFAQGLQQAPDAPASVALKRFESRLRKRIDAGHLVMEPILHVLDERPLMHEWGGRWNRSAATEHAVKLGSIDWDKFNDRHWAPSLPVLHLAASLCVRMSEARRFDLNLDIVGRLINEPDLLNVWLSQAEAFEDVILAQIPRLQPADLVRIRVYQTA